jgi:hypothetical protein
VDTKPKIDPAETLVLDEDEIAELDDSSLTGIMRDASHLLDTLEGDTEPESGLDDLEFDTLESDD